MDILANRYRAFVLDVLHRDTIHSDDELQATWARLRKLITLRFQRDAEGTFSVLRAVENEIETARNPYYRAEFYRALSRTALWSEFERALEREVSLSEAILPPQTKVFRVYPQQLQLRPRHLVFMTWQASHFHSATDFLLANSKFLHSTDNLVVHDYALNIRDAVVPWEFMASAGLSDIHQQGEEDRVDRRLIEIANTRVEIEEGTEVLLTLLSDQFDAMVRQQRALSDSIKQFEEELRELSAWGRKFSNINLDGAGGVA